jgi:signal transduction histidine kinase/CheY-like chemotaxis protein/HPt (histidine-containing phosphotransfer) domain-containing protein
MAQPPKPKNEQERLKALRGYNILDTLPEPEIDDLTKLAANICDTPIALVTLLEENRQWMKSKIGLDTNETTRDEAFCSYAILEPDKVLEVENTLEDSRFKDNPLVTSDETRFRFYAGAPIVDNNGYPLGTVCVLDTKPRKLSEHQLETLQILSRQVMRQFELRVLINEQKKSNILLKKLSEDRNRFLSNMSHEIRTPLNAMVSTINLLEAENLTEEQNEYTSILKFSSENLMALVNDILDIDKVESGKIKLEKAPVKLRELLSSVQSAHSLRSEEKGVKLIVDIDENIPQMILGDSVRLAQVLNNLISNAVKFTESGYVKVTIDHLETRKEKAVIRFRVEDTGIGIDPAQVNTLFRRFNQADKSITRRFGGTGLGLAITKALVELMGSKINVYSKPGEGAEFSFKIKFPVCTETIKSSGKESKSFDFGKLIGHVLIVDDNMLNRVLTGKFLSKWNLRISNATNGQEALDRVKAEKFDLILMDLQMPIMDGYTAVRHIRNMEDSYCQKVPILAITASVLLEVRNKIEEYGMQGFIPKPFIPRQLWEAIRKYLDLDEQEEAAQVAPVDHLSEVRKQELFNLINDYTGGDEEFMQELIQSFIENFEEIKKDALHAVQVADTALFDDVIHKMKPSCQILKYEESYARLIGLVEQLDQAHIVENTKTVTQLLDQMIGELETLG